MAGSGLYKAIEFARPRKLANITVISLRVCLLGSAFSIFSAGTADAIIAQELAASVQIFC